MTDDTTQGPSEPDPPTVTGGDTTTTTAPPPAGETGSTRPVFRRSTTDKVVAGVSGGLARTFDIDPVLVRILTVVLALSFPPAFIAYLAAWLLVARDDEPSRSTSGGIALRPAGGIAFWVAVIVLTILALGSVDGAFRGGFNLVPLVLIGIGVALWVRDSGRTSTPSAQGTPPSTWSTTGTTVAAGAVPSPPGREGPAASIGADGGAGPPGQPPTAQQARPQPAPVGPPPPPRPRSPLGAVTLALALIASGVVAALDQVPEVPLDAGPTHLAAVALLVLGVGQLVGAVWGRARWLTLVAILLLPPVVVGAAIREVAPDFERGQEVTLGDGIGERTVRLQADDPLPDDVRVLAGSITVDLEDWAPDDDQLAAIEQGDRDLVVAVGVGEVVLITPTDVPWRVLAAVGVGEVSVRTDATTIQQDSADDFGTPLRVVETGGPQHGPVLDIVVDLRLGEFDLRTPVFNDPQELS